MDHVSYQDQALLEEALKYIQQISQLFSQTVPRYGYDHPYGPNAEKIGSDLCHRLMKRLDELKKAEKPQ